MNDIIEPTLVALRKAKSILSILDDELLSNSTIPPYKSSIGSHIRHILDFYNCMLSDNYKFEIDLTIRKRDLFVETKCNSALNYYNEIVSRLENSQFNLEDTVFVEDNFGSGKIKIKYTYGALLAQAYSHTIHHYAIINYIMNGLNISIKDSDFGYNPTTPKKLA